ncbi:MAG: CHAT domain-containing protein [Acidobacteria bacterium]|nr:CHAT domain-containing protein [Acidobacteriota bacterium]
MSTTIELRLSELCTADSVRRHVLVAQYPELVDRKHVDQLAESVRQHIRVDLTLAQGAAEAALTIANALGDAESLGRATRAKANTLWPKGQCRPAVELLEKAITHFELAGRADEVGRTLSTSIQPLILLGEYDRALESANAARQIFTGQNDTMRLARLEINVANIYHRQERYQEAITSYERAHRQLEKEGDIEAVGVALHNMAACLISLNEFDRAFDIYQQSREYFHRHNMPLLASQADYNIAYLYHLRGEYERALEALRNTSETCQRNGDIYHAALSCLDQSEIYLELNLAQEAAGLAAKALRQFESLGMGYEAARSLTNMAIAHSQNRDIPTATALFARAKEKFTGERHAAGEALVDLYRAVQALESGNLIEARELAFHASQFFRLAGLARKAVLSDLLLARIAHQAGNLPAALEQAESARRSLQTLDAPALNLYAGVVLGQILESSGDLAAGFQAYQSAREELESLRSGLQREELKIAFLENKTTVYEQLIGHCVRRGVHGQSAEEAFAFMEQAKCRSLMEALSERSRIGAQSSCESGRTPESHQLRQHLNSYYRRIEAEQLRQDGFRAETVERLWAEARSCEQELLRQLRQESPAAPGSLAPQRPTILTLSAIRASLDADTVLIEYCQVNGQLLAAVLSRNSLDIVPLVKLAQLKGKLSMLQFHFSKLCHDHYSGGKMERSSAQAVLSHLHELHSCLIAPLGPLPANHLVFVPHGSLHGLPMHALFDGNEFVIDQFTVSYAPSASIYAFAQGADLSDSGNSLVLGFSDPKAPSILEEAAEVARLLPNAKLLIGGEATQDALRQHGPGSRILHIATHGQFRRDNPMFSSIRLGDSFLSVYDLYDLRLPVDLLTLSGCGTGQGMVAAGDEFLGLTRGLLYAGARSLLLTLWDVNDRSTAELVLSFYSHYQTGRGRAACLRAAMREVRERKEHPFHWAPLMLVGKAP